MLPVCIVYVVFNISAALYIIKFHHHSSWFCITSNFVDFFFFFNGILFLVYGMCCMQYLATQTYPWAGVMQIVQEGSLRREFEVPVGDFFLTSALAYPVKLRAARRICAKWLLQH